MTRLRRGTIGGWARRQGRHVVVGRSCGRRVGQHDIDEGGIDSVVAELRAKGVEL